jgi:Haem-dependent oxidative N-demethylase, alpha subunit-like
VPLTFREVVDHSLFPDGPFRWRLGTRSLPRESWLQCDDARERDLAEKAALIESRPDEMTAWIAGSESAGNEALALVESDLSELGLPLGSSGDHPIDRAGRSVQEDLCLLERQGSAWILTAGSVCFPTRWTLRTKAGKSLSAIHEPVPRYAEEIGARVDRFFDRMIPGSLVWRLNWSIVGEADRRLDPLDAGTVVPPTDPDRELFLRVERQTLRRLVDHDAVVFGIRIHVWPLHEVVDGLPPSGLATALETMPIDVADYKNLEAVRAALLRWLRHF